MSIPNLENTLKQLRLSGLARTLSVRLQEAAGNRLNHEEFLETILQDELNVRKERMLSRRTKAADFHRLKTLEDFDWRFNPAIPRKQIYDLATGQFIRQATDVLFIGPPGVGKTHLAQALGYEAIKLNFQVLYRSIFDLVRDFLKDEAFNQQDRVLRRYLKPDLLIIDDMGLKVAAVGRLPDTLADRCIVIRMHCKTMAETCERLRNLQTSDIKRQCARFT